MKIQHAFHNFKRRKTMAAAAHIQHRFKLHSGAFKRVSNIVRLYGLRWRLKKKGFRGLKVNPIEDIKDENQESDVEEDFFKSGRKQAEERVERSVIRVQAMFRSKKAQQEYSRMKMTHRQAKLELELEELINIDVDMLTTKTS